MSQSTMYQSRAIKIINGLTSVANVKQHPARIAKLNQEIAEAAADGEGKEYIQHFTDRRDALQAEHDSYYEAGLVPPVTPAQIKQMQTRYDAETTRLQIAALDEEIADCERKTKKHLRDLATRRAKLQAELDSL